MKKYLDVAKKIKALSDRGIAGEKTAAKNMLAKLMKKHSITIEEIEGEKTNDYYFNVKKTEFQLWYQIAKSVNHDIPVMGPFPVKVMKQYYLKGNYCIVCTSCEYVEIEAKHEFYKMLYKSELDIFYSAFLDANDLLVDNPSKEKANFSDSEMSDIRRISEMSSKIKKGQFHKQLSF